MKLSPVLEIFRENRPESLLIVRQSFVKLAPRPPETDPILNESSAVLAQIYHQGGVHKVFLARGLNSERVLVFFGSLGLQI